MATAVYTPYVAATLNGDPIEGVKRARVVSSFTDPVTKIYVTVYPRIEWAEGDEIAVTMGSGTNNLLSATGFIYAAQSANSTGSAYEIQARGPLFKAQKYINNTPGGITLDDLTSGPATDEAITMAVLDWVGVSYDPLEILGTGIVRGSLAPDAYVWREGESALAYLVRLTKASLGFRMVETIGGGIQRVQVRGRPQAEAQFTLTEGVDIFAGAQAQLDTLGKYTAVTVSGFDYGDGSGAVSYSIPDPTPVGVEPFVYSSEMIERALDADDGDGISAENVATNFVEPEVNRISLHVNGIRTPRDDLFGPGQTHAITSPLLDLEAEKLWLHSVTRECDERWFSQTNEYVGGVTTTGGYTGPGGAINLTPEPVEVVLELPAVTGLPQTLLPDAVAVTLAVPTPTVTV